MASSSFGQYMDRKAFLSKNDNTKFYSTSSIETTKAALERKDLSLVKKISDSPRSIEIKFKKASTSNVARSLTFSKN
jgi:hypothetical protein